jgi:ElaA protein
VSYSGSSIGRVVVSPEARGGGLAKSLMLAAIKTCTQQWPKEDIQIGAQVYLQEFYTQLGFKAFSKPYDEDGIMHIDMQYKLRN